MRNISNCHCRATALCCPFDAETSAWLRQVDAYRTLRKPLVAVYVERLPKELHAKTGDHASVRSVPRVTGTGTRRQCLSSEGPRPERCRISALNCSTSLHACRWHDHAPRPSLRRIPPLQPFPAASIERSSNDCWRQAIHHCPGRAAVGGIGWEAADLDRPVVLALQGTDDDWQRGFAL